MIRSKIQKYEMLGQVAKFAVETLSLFPKETAAAEVVTDLQSVVEKLSVTKASQQAAKEQVRTSHDQRLATLEELRNRVEAIHRTAGALNITGFSLPEKPTVSA